MRLSHYPPDGNTDEKEFGAAEHKDYGFLTILAQIPKAGSKSARQVTKSSRCRREPTPS